MYIYIWNKCCMSSKYVHILLMYVGAFITSICITSTTITSIHIVAFYTVHTVTAEMCY